MSDTISPSLNFQTWSWNRGSWSRSTAIAPLSPTADAQAGGTVGRTAGMLFGAPFSGLSAAPVVVAASDAPVVDHSLTAVDWIVAGIILVVGIVAGSGHPGGAGPGSEAGRHRAP